MSTTISNISRKDRTLTTPVLRQQRSSCAVVIHRFRGEDTTTLVNMNVTKDTVLSNAAKAAASKTLKINDPLVIRQDITRCMVTNNKSGNGGNFNLTVKRGKMIRNGINTPENVDYLASIQPGDWIMIYMKKTGEITDNDLKSTTPDSGLKFLGIVENVREIELDDPNAGRPRLDILITGRSFAKVFDTEIFFNPIVNKEVISAVLGADFLTDSSKTVKPLASNTADQVIKRLAKFYLSGSGASRSSANQNWYIPESLARTFKGNEKNKPLGKAFIDLLNTSRIGLQNYRKGVFQGVQNLPGVALIKALPSSGTIWAVMQFMQNSAVNELYTELVLDSNGQLKPGLVLRQMPFSNRPKHETSIIAAHNKYNPKAVLPALNSGQTYFVELPNYRIVSSDIKNKNIGKSDHERINYTIVVPKIDDKSLDVLYVAGSNPPSIQRYGLKMFQAQTSYVLNTGSSAKDGLKQYCARCVNLIQDWFFLAHNLYNGTLVVDGVDGFVEVGTNVYITDIKQLFHIEGYTHTFQVLDEAHTLYETEFRVSRGQFWDESANKAAFISSNSVPNEATTVVTSFLARSKEG